MLKTIINAKNNKTSRTVLSGLGWQMKGKLDAEEMLALMEIERLYMDCYKFLDRENVFQMYREFEQILQSLADPNLRKHILQFKLFNLQSELSKSGEDLFLSLKTPNFGIFS